MSLEERLKTFRLHAPAQGVRERILSAARGARRERTLWRWTWGIAAATLAIAIPLNAQIDRPTPPPRSARIEREAAEIARGTDGDRFLARVRTALVPPRIPKVKEIAQ